MKKRGEERPEEMKKERMKMAQKIKRQMTFLTTSVSNLLSLMMKMERLRQVKIRREKSEMGLSITMHLIVQDRKWLLFKSRTQSLLMGSKTLTGSKIGIKLTVKLDLVQLYPSLSNSLMIWSRTVTATKETLRGL